MNVYRYTWDLDDLASTLVARRRLLLRNRWLRYASYLSVTVLAVATAIGLPTLLVDASKPWHEKLLSTLPAVGAWVTVYLLSPRNILNKVQLRAYARSLPEGSRSVEWGYHDDGLWSRNAMALSNYRWEMFARIVETPECFLFYQGDLLALWLPGKAFPTTEALRSFVEAARGHVADYLALGDCRCPAPPNFPGWHQG